MKRIIGITLCLFIGYYGNAQSAKVDKKKAVANDKQTTQVILPNETADTKIQTVGAVSAPSNEAIAVPLSQEKQTERINEPLRNNVKAIPEKKK